MNTDLALYLARLAANGRSPWQNLQRRLGASPHFSPGGVAQLSLLF
ncbi:MAG: hypothetical protein HKP12_03970 [Gammaproteobacteria bacterium]|nr:hypothetical protein [Gammaproteobacteria bacterium]